jgi:hypothetical protein
MAFDVYKKGITALGKSQINLTLDTIKVALIDLGAYTPNMSTDEYLSDIPAGARVAISPALTNKTLVDGIFDADDTTFTSVSGAQCEALVLYQDTGVASTSRLFCKWDNNNPTTPGLPITPDGGNIDVAWSNTADKIFNLDY